MSDELETRLGEAFAARATTTTTSPDAWARVNRRVARHDHRRSVVLRSVAAAAIVVLAVGGGVALFRDGGSGTVATGGGADASKSMAEDTSGSAAANEAIGAAPAAPAGDQLEIARDAGMLRVRLSTGSNSIGPNYPGGMSAAVDEGRVFGVVPADAATVRLTDSFDEGIVLALVETFGDPRAPDARFFIIDGVPARRFVRIEARNEAGLEVRSGTIDLEAG